MPRQSARTRSTELDRRPAEGRPLVKPVIAVILAGGEGERLSILSSVRAKPAVPFGGKYRIIDFTLSNCVNSGHRQRRRPDPVQPALAQRPHRARPAVGPRPQHRRREAAPAVHRARARGRVVRRHGRRGAPELQRHRARRRHGARPRRRPHLQDGLPAVPRRPPPEAGRRDDRRPPGAARRGVADGRPRARRPGQGRRVAGEAEAAQERPRVDGRVRVLEAGAPALADGREPRDFGRDVIPAMLEGGARVYGYRFDGYWQDVGTIQSFWEANMALLDDNPELDLYDREWLIHTRSEERAPAKVGPTAQVHRSLDLARLRDQRDGRQQRPVARRAGGRRRGRARLDRDVRHGDPVRRRWSTGRSSTRRSSSGRGRSSATAPTSTRPTAPEPSRLNTGITVVGKQSVIPRGVAARAQREGRREGALVRLLVADGPVRRHGRPQGDDPQGRHGRRATGPHRGGRGRVGSGGRVAIGERRPASRPLRSGPPCARRSCPTLPG